MKMNLFRLLVFFMVPIYVLLAIPIEGNAENSILSCTFNKIAFLDPPEKGGPKIHNETFTVIFAGLDSDTPTMKGNMGESKLAVLHKTKDAVWLAETPPMGGLNVWTIFPGQRAALMSKQYFCSICGDEIMGLMSLAKCE